MKYSTILVDVGLYKGCPLLQILLVIFIDSISRHSPQNFLLGFCRSCGSSSSDHDLQRTLGHRTLLEIVAASSKGV